MKLFIKTKKENHTKKSKAMKTVKIITALSVILLIAALNTSSYAQTSKVTTYYVKVDNNLNPADYAAGYSIFLTDESGKLIAPPQTFRFGLWSYIFKENRIPVGKMRVAHMEATSNATHTSIVVDPVSIMGPFIPGNTYTLVLTPKKR